MAEYTDLLPEIQPHVIACPLPSILLAIKSQAVIFFELSQAWIHRVNETAVQGQALLAISDLPTATRLAAPLELYADGEPLATANHRMMTLQYGEDYEQIEDTPSYIMLADNSTDSLRLVPTPTGGQVITGRVAVKPLRTATGVEDAILDEFADGLIHGALARLYDTKNSEWYDTKAATAHQRAFLAEIEKAKSLSRKENTSRVMTTGYGGL